MSELPKELAQRPERDPLPVRRTAADQHRRLGREPAHELPHQPRLADARLAYDGDKPGALAIRNLRVDTAEPREHILATDQRGVLAIGQRSCLGVHGLEPEQRHSAPVVVQLQRRERRRRDGVSDELVRLLAEHDLA